MVDNMDNDYSVKEISYADVMQLELFKKYILKQIEYLVAKIFC